MGEDLEKVKVLCLCTVGVEAEETRRRTLRLLRGVSECANVITALNSKRQGAKFQGEPRSEARAYTNDGCIRTAWRHGQRHAEEKLLMRA
jgi:hypothetical protein